MLPITGPVTAQASSNQDAAGSYLLKRVLYGQKKPYDLPLPYLRVWRECIAASGPVGYGGFANATSGHSPPGYIATTDVDDWAIINDAHAALMNVARSKFAGELGESSETMVNLAERKQAMGMMATRAMQLFNTARSLRRFDFVGAAKHLGVLKHPAYQRLRASDKLRSNSKAFANNWLEFYFGWKPLIGDIGASIDLLQGPIPLGTIVGKSSRFMTPTAGFEGTYQKVTTYHQVLLHALLQAEVRVINPNLYLANRLGLINPTTVAWELVPFSFVVDWFVPVSDFLNQWTEFAGLEVINPFYTQVTRDDAVRESLSRPYSWGPWTQWDNTIETRSHVVRRSLGIPEVTLVARRPWRLKKERALTAISLLLQQGLKGVRAF